MKKSDKLHRDLLLHIDEANNLAGRKVVTQYNESKMYTISVYKEFVNNQQFPDGNFIGSVSEAIAFVRGVCLALKISKGA